MRIYSNMNKLRMFKLALLMACYCTLCTLLFYLYLLRPFPPPLNLLQSFSKAPNQSFGLEDDAQSSSSSVINPPLAIHNFTTSRSQMYQLEGDIRIHGNSSTIFLISSSSSSSSSSASASWITKPYARNFDSGAMPKVTAFQIQIINNHSRSHDCARNFSLPAIVFSSRGYSGNPYHDFTDILIPLYLTSRQFNAAVLFLVADMRSTWWTSKYSLILQNLSRYDIIDIHNHTSVVCFPRVIVGLTSHKELSIDPSKPPYYSVRDFTALLRTTYSLDRHRHHRQVQVVGKFRRPRLLIVSRKKTRRLTNAGQVAEAGRRLGFDVVVTEMEWGMSRVAALVNSFDAMVGVHGAGLTNMLFLPANAVVIQIVPIGLVALAKLYYQGPAEDMGLRYMEYRVTVNESSLSESSSQLVAKGWRSLGWPRFRSIYLVAQDITVDVGRFKETLSRALALLLSAR